MDDLPVDYSRKWYVLAAVGMGIFLSTIDGSIVNIALPFLETAFDTEFAIVQWVVLAYLLVVSTLMLGVGRLADMIGKKPLYTAGFIIFTIGSVLAGLSPTIYWLIGFRVLQALGAVMLLALGLGIVTEAFPPSERGKALGITGALVSVGIVLGPTLGGILINLYSWRLIFYVNLPVGIAGTIMAVRYLPDIRPPGGQRFDFGGAVTLLISLLSFSLALTAGQDLGFTDPLILILFAAFVLFLILFIAIELRVEQPMVDLRLLNNARINVSLVTGYITFVAIGGTVILMPFYLGNVLGYSALQVGLLMAVVPIVLGIAAPISGSLSDRYGTRPITVIGLFVLAIGYLALGTLQADTSALGFVLRFLPIGIGMGIFQSPNNSAIMGTAPRRRLGIVSGMLAATRSLGQTTGVALIGAVWAARVFAYVGKTISGGATEASGEAQVTGLQDTFRIVTVFVILALMLAVWSLMQERRDRSLSPAELTATR
ncbi:MAG: MFS transporter [Candidatus Promineifilaceae bacterium]